MNKIAFLASLLLFAGFALTSCTPESVEDISFDEAQLRGGTWTVDRVEVNDFDGAGNLVSSDLIKFGEGEQGGICTFNYSDGKWTMVDNGRVFESDYQLDGRVIYTDNGGEWGIRSMSDESLEMVQRGQTVSNPCDFSVSGSVYYLTRNSR